MSARCLRCKAGSEWIEGDVKVRVNDVTFTPHQVEFLRLTMQDFLDVSIYRPRRPPRRPQHQGEARGD